MLITFECPGCGADLEVEADAAGSQLECPACKAAVSVPRKGPGPGTTIGGFKISKLLGSGAMGEVYLARQLSMDRDVALKILPGALTLQKDLVERFLQEVRMLAKLDHPNIVTAFEAGEDGGVYFMAMAYVKGDPLDVKLERDGALPEKQALRMILKLARALAHAWDEHRLIHRDVKPGNIMLDKHDEPRLMDLGLSKTLTQATTMTVSGTVVGTPNYMSPEQAEGRLVDFRSDMYSLGSTLYHMLTGQVPFGGTSIIEVLRKQATEDLPDPRAIRPDIGDACVALMEIMLAKDPAHRHGDWGALIADTERVLAGGHPTRAPLKPGESVLLRSQALTVAHGEAHKRIVLTHSEGQRLHKKELPGAKKATSWMPLAVVILALLAVAGAGIYLVSRRAGPAPASTPKAEAVLATPVVTAVAPQADADRARLEALAAQFAEAVNYSEEHPTDYAEARSRFERIVKSGAGTEFAQKAAESLRRLGAAEQEAVDEVVGLIAARAEKLYDQGHEQEAVESILDYNGPLAERTTPARRRLSDRFARRAENASRGASERTESDRAALDRIVDEVAAALFRGDMAAAGAAVTDAQRNTVPGPVADELAGLRKNIDAVASMPKMILDSFRDEVGQEVAVDFKTGPQTLKIVSVGPGEVRAKRRISAAGYAEIRFAVHELTPQEKFKRLEGPDAAATGILRGLMLLYGRKPGAALKFFRDSGSPLGDALAAQLIQRLEGPREAAAEEAGPADVPPAALEPVAPSPPPIEPPPMEEVIARLEEANPQAGSLASAFDVTDRGIEVDLSENPRQVDITPLQGLPLTRLKLTQTKVRDLGPLRGMPLTWLCIAGTPVSDLTPLQGMPLRELFLSGCRNVKDLKPLEGMPLVLLDMAGTSVNDLTPLATTQLKTLDIAGVPAKDLSPLRELPLQTLGLFGTPVRDLSPLKGMSTLTTIRWGDWDQYWIVAPVRENLQKGDLDAAAAAANAMADTMDGTPALAAFAESLRALAGERIAEWKTMAGGDIKSLAKSFNGHRYAMALVPKDRKGAQEYCSKQGAHLAAIGSRAEMDWITATFGMPGIPVWLGGTDEEKEGAWKWLTGEPWGFSNWLDGQPDNWNGKEHAVAFMGSGKWQDLTADDLCPFLMEWDP